MVIGDWCLFVTQVDSARQVLVSMFPALKAIQEEMKQEWISLKDLEDALKQAVRDTELGGWLRQKRANRQSRRGPGRSTSSHGAAVKAGIKLTFLSLKLTFLSLKLTFLSLQLTRGMQASWLWP